MMATAFESLLDLSDTGKTRDFVEKVETFLVSKAQAFVGKSASRHRRKLTRLRARDHTNAGWWAYDFYDVRSSIVHGRKWNLLYDGKSQMEIADLVFIEVLKRKLEEKRLFTYTSEDEDFRKDIYKAVGF